MTKYKLEDFKKWVEENPKKKAILEKVDNYNTFVSSDYYFNEELKNITKRRSELKTNESSNIIFSWMDEVDNREEELQILEITYTTYEAERERERAQHPTLYQRDWAKHPKGKTRNFGESWAEWRETKFPPNPAKNTKRHPKISKYLPSDYKTFVFLTSLIKKQQNYLYKIVGFQHTYF